MAAIFEELSLTWGGEEYKIKPTYSMIQKIESQGISIAGVLNRTQRGEPPFTQISQILSILLQSAGAKTSAEDLYQYIFTECDQRQVSDIVLLVSTAFIPKAKTGNEPAPKKGQK